MYKPDFDQKLGFSKENRFALDLDKLCVSGHSMGGCTAFRAAQSDDRIKCCLTLDMWLLPMHKEVFANKFTGLSKPLFMINSETFPAQAKSFSHPKCYLKILDQIKSKQFDEIIILDSAHEHQTDAIVILNDLFDIQRIFKERKLPKRDAHLVYQVQTWL